MLQTLLSMVQHISGAVFGLGLSWGCKSYICLKVTNMEFTIGHRMDYTGLGVLRGPRPAAHTQQKLTQVPPRGKGGREKLVNQSINQSINQSRNFIYSRIYRIALKC